MVENPPKKLHVAMLPSPGIGHLIPMVELARKFLHLNDNLISITFIFPNDVLSSIQSLLQTLPQVNSIFLPPPAGNDPPEDAALVTKIVDRLARSLPSLRQVVTQLIDPSNSNPLSVFIIDLFGSFTIDVIKELRIPIYMFYTSSAASLSSYFYLPELDASCDCEFVDLPAPVKIPGFVPIRSSDLSSSFKSRKKPEYTLLLENIRKSSLADGILVNSFLELEPETFDALKQGRKKFGDFINIPPIYPIGPLVRTEPKTIPLRSKETECLNWLDQQPPASVLFVSFGSGGSLSNQQLTELALGLELSNQKFLFVAKKPNDKDKSAAYFTDGKTEDEVLRYLPCGFVERSKEVGFILPEWAPQVEILRHMAVAGFLTHCGWNSTLESIVHGVPLIVWPLFAEQRTNAVLLTEVLKVGIRVEENEDGMVRKEQIAIITRRLIKEEEGKEMIKRMKNLQREAIFTVGNYGSSAKSLVSLTQQWK